MSNILEVRDVRVSYGPMEVIKGVNLQVREGETFAVLGPNGAGKTTLFKVMTGEVPCRSGTIRFRGEVVTRVPAFERVRRGMGRTFQVARVFLELTVLTNVVASVESRLRGSGKSCGKWYAARPSAAVVEEAEAMLRSVGLQDMRHIEAKLLSHGDKKRLEFALVLALGPTILMLDEPTAGMSQADRRGIAELIRRVRTERGISIVMTEHDMDVIFGLADRLIVLNYGEVIAFGSPGEVRADPVVREVYLGKEMAGA